MPEKTKAMGYSSFSVNVEAARTHFETLNGREYLVGPAVIAREGVMNRVLYTAYELQRSLRTWNGRPIILRHSYDSDGRPISANSPEILNQQGLGFMFNTTWGADKKLRTDVWLSMDAIKEGKIAGIDKNGKITTGVLELSTGIFHQYIDWGGDFEGEPYDIEAFDCVGDHLALLPDQTGAYSVKAGAGFPRWNVALAANTSQHKKLIEYVRGLKAELVSVDENFFVYSLNEVLYKKGHAKKDGVFLPLDSPEIEVKQHLEFVSINATTRPNMPTTPETPPTTATPPAQAQKPDISTFSKDEIVAAFNSQVKPDEMLTMLSAKVPWLADAKGMYDAERVKMIDTIAANANCEFTKEELAALPHATLTKLHRLSGNATTPAAKTDGAAPRFDAAGATPVVLADNTSGKPTAQSTVDPLPEPTLKYV